MEEGGFEPPKSVTADLQSAPFGRSGTLPIICLKRLGAGGRTRTPDLLITNQLLYQLSYTSVLNARLIYHKKSTSSSLFLNFFNFFIYSCFIDLKEKISSQKRRFQSNCRVMVFGRFVNRPYEKGRCITPTFD